MSEPFVYASELSPFGARVRIAVAAKRLPIEFRPPPGPPRSVERIAITPLARFPTLIDGDLRIVESLAILDYLEDRYADGPRLVPLEPARRAIDRGIALAFDNYVFPLMMPLFGQLASATPDHGLVERGLDQVAIAWRSVAALFEGSGLALGGTLTLADCAMAPFATSASLLAARFGARSPLDGDDRLAEWLAAVRQQEVIQATDARIRAAFAAMFGDADRVPIGASR